jgi:two-component system sensor histidine kinase EvgS
LPEKNNFVIVLVFFALSGVLTGSPLFAFQNSLSSPTVILSGAEIDYPPFSFVDINGKPTGFAVELFDASLSKMGCVATYTTGYWAEVKANLKNGRIDALPLVGRTPEREKQFDFTVPYMKINGALIIRKDNQTLTSVNNLTGKEVAVMKNDNAEEFLDRNSFNAKKVVYSTFLDALKALNQGRHDAVIIQKFVAEKLIFENDLKNLKIVNKPIDGFQQDFCFAVQEGDKATLALLNEGLAKSFADGTFDLLYAKWFAKMEIPRGRRLVIGGDHNFPPFEYIDENGRPAGYNIDLMRALASATNLEIEFRLQPWPEVIEALESDQVDIIQGMFYSPERATKFYFSVPHLVSNYISVTRKGDISPPENIEDLKGLKILVQNQDIMHDFLIKNGLASEAVLVDSQQTALWNLVAGNFDCALLSRFTALYWKEKYNWKNLQFAHTPLFSQDYCFVTSFKNKAIVAQFNEGLRIISESGKYKKIHDKWFGMHDHANHAYRVLLYYISLVTVPLFLIAAAGFLWSWSLKVKVRKKTLDLLKSEEQFKNLIEGAPYAIFVQIDGKFAYLNEQTAKLTGHSCVDELIGKEVIEIFDPATVDGIRKSIFKLEHQRVQIMPERNELINTDGMRLPVEVSAVPIKFEEKNGSLVFVRDISRQLELEEKLRHTSKMEAVGLLAGGIAHDYNNMLGVIIGYAELALFELSDDDPMRNNLQEIHNAAQSSVGITRQLLAFARKQTITPVSVNLNVSVESIFKMLTRLIGEDIELIWFPQNDLWNIKLDPSQIDQILANLCVNARDAITQNGKIVIKTENKLIVDKQNSDIPPGEYVKLSVCDNGQGMSKETLEQIFEPFFTTKPMGVGTGLGLSTVYGIVSQNNGFLNIESAEGKGTTFEIFFPRNESIKENIESKSSVVSMTGIRELIMIVEDDESILRLSEKILSKLNYHIVAFTSPIEALNKAEKLGDKISLVITDVVMPEMNGKELHEKIKQKIGDVPFLFVSGYTADIISEHGILQKGVEFLEKPYSIQQLSEKVRQILDADASSA